MQEEFLQVGELRADTQGSRTMGMGGNKDSYRYLNMNCYHFAVTEGT